MRLWLDAHTSPSVATWLRTHYEVEATALRDLGLRDADDEEIFEAARAASACILTKDRDFVEMVRRRGTPPGILWVTCGNTSTRTLCEILESALPDAKQLFKQGEALVEITDRQRF